MNVLNTMTEQITVDATAGGKPLTEAKYAGASKAYITVETASLRFTVDTTAPTSSVGHRVASGGEITLESTEEIRNFRAIRDTGVSALITVTYYR